MNIPEKRFSGIVSKKINQNDDQELCVKTKSKDI